MDSILQKTFAKNMNPYHEAVKVHHLTQDSIVRKMRTQHLENPGSIAVDHEDITHYNVEEMIMYVLLVLLLLYLFTQFVRCVRITLDPYNTSACGAWMEPLEKNDLKIASNFDARIN